MSRLQVLLLCAFALLLAIATGVYIQHTNIAILDPAGPVALAERNIIFITAGLCAIVVIPVFFLLFYFAWRYRAGSLTAHVEHSPDWDHDNWVAELVWWVIPGIIISILGVMAVQSSNALDPYKPLPGNDQLTIDVVALDWKWLFIYPQQGIASVNLVEFPENTPVHFYLTADAPMNSFWVPQLAGQMMVMPGMTTQLNLEASRTGDFNGSSANISGEGFAGMAFTARAVTQDQFNSWVANIASSSPMLSQNAYASLVAPSEYNSVEFYAPVGPDLFNSIISKYLEPGSAMSAAMAPTTDTMGGPASTADEPIGSMHMTP